MNHPTRRLFGRLAVALPLGLAALSAAPAFGQAKEPVKVGVVLSMSGPAAVFGLPERDAINSVYKERSEERRVGKECA